jgi:hypothetical protein
MVNVYDVVGRWWGLIEGWSNRAFMHYIPHFREYENRGELWTFRCLSNEQPCFEDPLWIYLLISNSLAAPRHEAFRERMGEDPLSP